MGSLQPFCIMSSGRWIYHYSKDKMGEMVSQITDVSIVCPTVCSGVGQRKHQSPASLAFVKGIHRWLVGSSHKGPITWKMFPSDDVIMWILCNIIHSQWILKVNFSICISIFCILLAGDLALLGVMASADTVMTDFRFCIYTEPALKVLTHWSQVTHICISKLNIIGSDNGLLRVRHQAITWTNAGTLLTGPLGTNFSEILIEIHIFPFRKMHLKMLSEKWQPFCLGHNVLRNTLSVQSEGKSKWEFCYISITTSQSSKL